MPTAEVAGDSFDYAINGSRAHVAIVDAMGHGLEAPCSPRVAIGALRNARRAGASLSETVARMDRAITSSSVRTSSSPPSSASSTSTPACFRGSTADIPPALLVREGRVVKTLTTGIRPPLGLRWDAPQLGVERLQPDDRLLLYSDGVVEARAQAGEFFGPERLAQFITKQASARSAGGGDAAPAQPVHSRSSRRRAAGRRDDGACPVAQPQSPRAGRAVQDLVERLDGKRC